jgi:hypothetical protein
MVIFFWIVVVFIVLSWLSNKYLSGPIGSIIEIRKKWFELSNTVRGFEIGLNFDKDKEERPWQFHLQIFRMALWYYLPVKWRLKKDWGLRFGFYSIDGEFPVNIIYQCGQKSHIKETPLCYVFEGHTIFDFSDNKWFGGTDSYKMTEKELKRFLLVEKEPMIYINKNNKEQKTEVSAYISKRTWRRKIFRWLRIPVFLRRVDLELEFTEDIGIEKGTWKGGVMACSVKLPKEAYKNLDGINFEEEHYSCIETIKDILDRFMHADKKY